jgi:hypothetical protein
MRSKSKLEAESQTTRPGRPRAVEAAKHRRRTSRYTLHARTQFHWTDDEGLAREAQGYTRDISPKGVYVFAAACPPRGAALTMNIFLPVFSPDSGDLRLEAEGRVVRVDLASGEGCVGGFSVRNERVKLCTS